MGNNRAALQFIRRIFRPSSKPPYFFVKILILKIPIPPIWPALLYLGGMAGLAFALHFNGLYGQDAHEYLRQSQQILGRLQGLPAPPSGPGDAEIAGGYPLMAALLQYLGINAILSLQLVNWLAAAVALWLFERILSLLSPGTTARSRWVFAFGGLGLAPYFLRAAQTAMSDTLGLLFGLTALFFVLRLVERERSRSAALGFAVFAAMAITTRYALAALLFLPALALTLELWRMRRFGDLFALAIAFCLASLPFWWLKSGAPASPLAHSLLSDWSLLNLFKKTFSQASGSISYSLPNLVYLFFPLLHPGFCLSLPALYFLSKKTDIRLYSKRLLLLSLICYLLFLGGLPHQNLRYLLPAYAVLLLLFFPAWDRFFAYGLYFFKRLTYALLGLTLAFQLAFSVYILQPVIARNKLERQVAFELNTRLQPGNILFAFDLDIALKSYLPELEHRNLWMQPYDTFPAGSFILFNAPKLSAQWAGQLPMRNWEHANAHFKLQEVQPLPEGWMLYQVVGPR